MIVTTFTRAQTSLLVLVASLLGFQFIGQASPPTITNLTMISGRPRLGIQSAVGITNEIQTLTNLSQTNWSVLASLVVTQSSYAFTDNISTLGPQRFYRVRDPNPAVTGAPNGMALIPAGSFQMGNTFDPSEGEIYEVPLHTVYVSAFYMDKYEVSKALWDGVLNWSSTHGYAYDHSGSGKAPTHPVQTINWFDMVKWCNARSEKEGRLPAYYTDAGLTQVYKTGDLNPYVNWSGGYRLPTEAEWEKGSRGGASGHRFPWSDSDTITHSRANYFSDASYPYDISPTRGFNPAFNDGVQPFTSPVGSFAPNDYGLYDTAGNVWEWCWDWAGNYASAPQTDPRGPATGDTRVGKGGNWNYYAQHLRNSYRYGNSQYATADNIGFRCALTAP